MCVVRIKILEIIFFDIRKIQFKRFNTWKFRICWIAIKNRLIIRGYNINILIIVSDKRKEFIGI